MFRSALLLMCVVAATVLSFPAFSYGQTVQNPIVMQFNPVDDQYDRYMLRLSLQGTVVKPWTAPDYMNIPEFFVNAIWEDRVTDATEGVNKHRINFYRYDVITMNYSSGYNPSGGAAGGPGGSGGGLRGAQPPATITGGSFGIPNFSDLGDGSDPLNKPGSLDLALPNGGRGRPGGIVGPMQEDGSGGDGGGDKAGGPATNFDISRITTNAIDYVTLKTGQVIDIRGLELMSDYSDAQVNDEEIVVDVQNLFEWSHMLVLPPYPVYIEDFWYAELPLKVPGLPEKVPMRFYYQVLDFRRVLTRRIAVIDMSGLVEFDQYWDREDKEKGKWYKKYRAFGNMGIAARYMFDLDKQEIFAIARPQMLVPRNFFKGDPWLPGDSSQFGRYGQMLYGTWGINNCGLAVTTDMRFFTKLDDKRVLRTSAGQTGPVYERKYMDVTYFGQMEAE